MCTCIELIGIETKNSNSKASIYQVINQILIIARKSQSYIYIIYIDITVRVFSERATQRPRTPSELMNPPHRDAFTGP